MKDQNNNQFTLTDGQQAILDVIKLRGRATRQDIQAELKQFAHSTIDTNLRELKNKGLISVDQAPQERQRFEQIQSVSVNTYTPNS